jgi:hypothetical protein
MHHDRLTNSWESFKINPISLFTMPLGSPIASLDRLVLRDVLELKALPPKSPEDQLELLSSSAWYPLGLPPLQVELDEPFSKTHDALRLMEELGRRRSAGEPVFAIVANPSTNIELALERRFPDLESEKIEEMALERRRLLGLKDKLFYETAGAFVASEARKQGSDEEIIPVPVFLMSDFESMEGFSELESGVDELFDFSIHPEFVEAVYGCVPKGRRSRRHRCKSYSELPEAHRKKADELCRYVLYQIAMVLFIGGTKLGHEGERPYDEVTRMASGLLAGHSSIKPLEFSEFPIEGATGVSPYRAKRGPAALRDPESFNAYCSLENYMDAHIPEANVLSERLKEFSAAQSELTVEIVRFMGSLSKNGEDRMAELNELEERSRAITEDIQRTILESCKKMNEAQKLDGEERADRAINFRYILHALLDVPQDMDEGDRELIRDALLEQDMRETLLSLVQAPKYRESFLLKRTGFVEAIEGHIPVSDLEARASEWVPFKCRTNPILKDYQFLAFAAEPLIGLAPSNSYGEWRIPRERFESAIFRDWLINPPLATMQDRINTIFAAQLNLFEKIKWEAMEDLFELIEGTPLQGTYQRWMGGVAEMTSEPIDEATAQRVRALLDSGVFNEEFKAIFLGSM